MTDKRSDRGDDVDDQPVPTAFEVAKSEQLEDPATTMMPPEREGPTVSPDMQGLIGRQLRAVYDDIATQPVPNRFVELLRQLEEKAV